MGYPNSQTAEQATQRTAIQQLTDFSQIAHLPYSILLESSLNAYGRGKNSFALRSPSARWEIAPNERIPANWTEKLDQFTADRSKFHTLFLSYEFGAEILTGDSLASSLSNMATTPKLLALTYDSVATYQNQDQSSSDLLVEASNFSRILKAPEQNRYLADVTKIKNHIREGDIYQANYTDQWQIQSELDPWSVYQNLRRLNPAQYSAFANLGQQTIVSSSPERLFTVTGDTIRANPIKGTIATGQTDSETLEKRRSLLGSEKDKAELLMIVDLLRNDLGKICKPGQVHTESIWRAEEYSSLIHLVGDIRGKLQNKVTLSDMIQALFPGGSITGAPKKRAVEILTEIETRPRGIYTGSIGYIYRDTIDFNIAIRTMTHEMSHQTSHKQNTYTVQAGGGIVADSDPNSEYNEARLKARNLIRAIDNSLEF